MIPHSAGPRFGRVQIRHESAEYGTATVEGQDFPFFVFVVVVVVVVVVFRLFIQRITYVQGKSRNARINKRVYMYVHNKVANSV